MRLDALMPLASQYASSACASVGSCLLTAQAGIRPARHSRSTSMARDRACSTLIIGQWPSVIRNCLPATLVATRKVRVRAFMRTQKPDNMRSRKMRPSRAWLFSSKDSVISTIGISFPLAKRGQISRSDGQFRALLL
jgi:hypothetical protein